MAALLLATGGCDLTRTHHASAGGPGPTVRLRDFAIDLSEHTVKAGPVDFHLRNTGPTVHEFAIVRTDRKADDLPLGPDGLSVAQKIPHSAFIDGKFNVELGEHDQLPTHLAPGHYVVYCNLEGHYLAGMRASFRVVK